MSTNHTKLTWDDSGTRFYELGVDHGILYVQNSDGTYASGVAWNGLTSVTESPDGAEPNDLWADNIKYATLRSAETFGGTIEAYTYPNEWAECDGFAIPISGANGVMLGQQSRKSFGLYYRTQVGNDVTDEKGHIHHFVWGATASPSERQYETINDSPDAITMSWEFTTVPVEVDKDHKKTSHIMIDSARLENGDDNTQLKALLDTIEGKTGVDDNGNDPTLPTPLAVLQAMGYETPST